MLTLTLRLSVQVSLVPAFLVFSWASATGQEGPSPKDSVASLPPVTITATRQNESVVMAPVAVTVLGKRDIENRNGSSLDAALRVVPGVFAQSRYGSTDVRVVIRGFGARGAGDRSNAGTSRGVRVLLDGIPETEPDGRTSFDLIDLSAAQRLEIVRSNASALYGNAAGGLIDITTAREVESTFASASQLAGSFGLLRTVLEGGSRVGDGSINASFTNTSQDGWRAHSDARRWLFNSAYLAHPSASTRAGVFVAFANDLFHIPGPLTRAQVDADPRAANASYASRDERRYNRVGRIGLTMNRDLTGTSTVSAMMFVSPKVLQRSERNTFRDFNRYHLGGNAIFRTETRFGPNHRGTTILGVDGAHQDGTILFYSLTPSGKRGTDLRDNKAEGATNAGVFAEQIISFDERVDVQLGARYDDIRYDYRSYITPRLNSAKSFKRLTPKLGLSVLLSPGHSIYANVGGGIEAPAGNETDPASTFGQDTVVAINPLLDAIRSTTYEIGSKHVVGLSEGFLHSLSYDGALYRTEVRNEIIPYRGGRFYFTAGKVRREGAELGAAVEGRGGLNLRGSVTLSRNRYTDYVVDSVHYGRPGATADYAGNDVAGVADFFYGASLGHDIPVGIPLMARLELRGVGDYFIDDANTVIVPAYHTLDLTIGLGRPIDVGGIQLSGFASVANLFNRRFIGLAYTNPDIVNGAAVAYEPGTPRSLIVSLSLSRGK